MITRDEELTLVAVRYLRRCLLEGDIEALIAAQFKSSDYELLEDPTHFIKTAQGQPTARLQITLNWGKAIDLVALANAQADSDCRISDVCRKTELLIGILDYLRRCLREGDYIPLAAAGINQASIDHLAHTRINSARKLNDIPASIRLFVDHNLLRIRLRRLQNSSVEHETTLRLIRCGATFEMMKHLTGITTHDFAGLRRIAGLSNRSRIPVRTDEEIELIYDLLERVCTDGKPPGKREYLEICNVSNDSQDLGKVVIYGFPKRHHGWCSQLTGPFAPNPCD